MFYYNPELCFKDLSAEGQFAYLNMVNGFALSQFLTGNRYIRIRNELVSKNYITYLASIRRFMPLGNYYEFDIFTKNTYERKNKRYTFQVRFRLWFPHCALQKESREKVLASFFTPIAMIVLDKLNPTSQFELIEDRFTLGIDKVTTNEPAHTNDVWSILVTKFETSKVITYRYDLVVDYQWRSDFVNSYDLCYIRVANNATCGSVTLQYINGRLERVGENPTARINGLYGTYVAECVGLGRTVEECADEFATIINNCPYNWRVIYPYALRVCL
jgi:hypothetical protein